MLWRLLAGALVGAIVGGLTAAFAIFVLGMTSLGPFVGYGLAALTGALTGLVAGKPIWARGAAIEAGLKAVFGALLAGGALFAMRAWLPGALNLSAWGAGSGRVSELAAAALPLVGTVLGALFGLDNTGDPPEASKKRVAMTNGDARVRAPIEDEAEEEPAAKRRTKN